MHWFSILTMCHGISDNTWVVVKFSIFFGRTQRRNHTLTQKKFMYSAAFIQQWYKYLTCTQSIVKGTTILGCPSITVPFSLLSYWTPKSLAGEAAPFGWMGLLLWPLEPENAIFLQVMQHFPVLQEKCLCLMHHLNCPVLRKTTIATSVRRLQMASSRLVFPHTAT